MFRQTKKILVFLVISSMILMPAASVYAQPEFKVEENSAESMAADLLVMRPLGLVALVAGSTLFVISLPFSTIGGNVEAAKEKLVQEPADFLLNRPLGEF